MSGENRGAGSPVDLTEEDYARAADSAGPEHTDVHRLGSRLMELLQDVAVLLLNVTLLGMGFVFLYRVWREIFAFGNLQEGLSNIILVVITIELYRLSVHYLRYHRVSLNLLVEVGVSAIIQKMILVGVDKYTIAATGRDLPDTRVSGRHPVGGFAQIPTYWTLGRLCRPAATKVRDLARERTRG